MRKCWKRNNVLLICEFGCLFCFVLFFCFDFVGFVFCFGFVVGGFVVVFCCFLCVCVVGLLFYFYFLFFIFYFMFLFYFFIIFFFLGGGGDCDNDWCSLNEQRVDKILLSTLNYLFYVQQRCSRDLFIKSCSSATEQNAFNNWISRSIRFTLPLDTGFLSTDIM